MTDIMTDILYDNQSLDILEEQKEYLQDQIKLLKGAIKMETEIADMKKTITNLYYDLETLKHKYHELLKVLARDDLRQRQECSCFHCQETRDIMEISK